MTRSSSAPVFLKYFLPLICSGIFLFATGVSAATWTPGDPTSADWHGDHYVSGDFTLSTAGVDSAGLGGGRAVSYYKLCRSQDANLGETRGCEVWVTSNNGLATSYTVTGTNKPSTNKQRWYYWYVVYSNGQEESSAGTYVRDMGLDTTVPTPPGAATTTWVGDHYVNADFTLATSGATDAESGVQNYRLCRSEDANLGEWRGCEVWITTTLTTTSYSVTGVNRPSAGKMRWYYWYATDYKGNLSGNSSGVYVRLDGAAPVQDAVTLSSTAWEYNDALTYDITLKASDSGSGFSALAAAINYQGSNSGSLRGDFAWNASGYYWSGSDSADQIACSGGGYAAKYALGWGQEYITLTTCSTSVSGEQRTVTLTVRPKKNFGNFGAINDISFYVQDNAGNTTGWTNYDLNFSSTKKLVPIVSCNFNPTTSANTAKGAFVAWQQTCGSALANFLSAAGVPADATISALQTGNLTNLLAALGTPNQGMIATGALTSSGSITATLKIRIQSLLCNSELNSYDRAQIITNYGLSVAPFSFSTALSCS